MNISAHGPLAKGVVLPSTDPSGQAVGAASTNPDAKAITSRLSADLPRDVAAKPDGKEAVAGIRLPQRLKGTAALLQQFMRHDGLRFEQGVREEIQEYIDHDEWGLAYESICAQIEHAGVKIDVPGLQLLTQAAGRMQMPGPPSGR